MEGLLFGGVLSLEGNFHFKIDWVGLIVGSKFTFLALFHFVFKGNGGFFCVTGLGGLYLEGLIHGAANFWNFTVSASFLVAGKSAFLSTGIYLMK